MPHATGSVVNAIIPADTPARKPFSQHFFVGGNSIILNILKNNIDELLLTASTKNFEATLLRLLELLQQETAEISVVNAGLDGESLNLALSIEQYVGHKFPTGFPSRRAWLHFTVIDGSGDVVFESGAYGDDGAIAGNSNDDNPGVYEPHYEQIERSDQVQIYETILQDTEGNVTTVLLFGAGYAKDNRLLPSGFSRGLE